MARRWKILLLALCSLIAVVAVCFFSLREPEPSYNGRMLSEWLDDYAPNAKAPTGQYKTIQQSNALHAIEMIGTNAIPSLLRWMDSGERPLQVLARTQTKVGFLRPLTLPTMRHFEMQRIRATYGFGLLGKRAAPAAPVLGQRFAACSKPEAWGIADILLNLEDTGYQVFADAITNRNHRNRDVALAYVRTPPRFADMVPEKASLAVLKVAQDETDPMSNASIEAIGVMGVVSDGILAVLKSKLTTGNTATKRSALKAIADLGLKAEPLLPQVESALHDPDINVRTHAADTYARLSREKAHDDQRAIQ